MVDEPSLSRYLLWTCLPLPPLEEGHIVEFSHPSSCQGIIIKPRDTSFEVWADADFTSNWHSGTAMKDPDTSRSRFGYTIMYMGIPILWKLQLQTEIALSSIDHGTSARNEASWIQCWEYSPSHQVYSVRGQFQSPDVSKGSSNVPQNLEHQCQIPTLLFFCGQWDARHHACQERRSAG